MKSKSLWMILAVALILRAGLLVALWPGPNKSWTRPIDNPAFTPDSIDYWGLSRLVAEHGKFDSAEIVFSPKQAHPISKDHPEIFRTPGYPFFLAAVYSLGKTQETWTPWKLSLCLQIILDVLLVGLTYLLGRMMVSRGVGLIAAALQAITPVAIAASCRILSDSLYALLLTTALLMMLRHVRFGTWRSLLAAAVMTTGACYVRPIGLVIAVILVAAIVLYRRSMRQTAAFVVILVVGIAPWIIRNAVVADYYGFSSNVTDSMYLYSAPAVLAKTEGENPETISRKLAMEELAYINSSQAGPRTAGEMARFRRQRAMEIISAHPLTYAGIHLRGCLAFWLPGATDVLEVAGISEGQRGTLAILHEQGFAAAVKHYFGNNRLAIALAVPLVAIFIVKFAAVVLCIAYKVRSGMPGWVWLFLAIVLASFLLGGPATTPRFRVPLEPLLSIAAAVGITGLVECLRRKKTHRA